MEDPHMRTLRWFLGAGFVLAIAGAAWAGGTACQSGKACPEKGSAQNTAACTAQQIAAGCCSKSAQAAPAGTSGSCSASAKAGCSASQQAACAAKGDMAGCTFCGFRSDLGASAGHVNFSAIDTRDGVIVVFAAASKEDVTAAQALAAKAYAMMSGGPAQCEVTKAKMADKNCVGCKAGLDAFTNADVKMENTEEGARAVVVSTDKNNVAKLHAFFQNLQVSEKTDVKG